MWWLRVESFGSLNWAKSAGKSQDQLRTVAFRNVFLMSGAKKQVYIERQLSR